MERLAALVHRRRRRVLAAAVVLFALGGVLGTPVAGQLSVHSSDFQDPNAENRRADALIARATHGGGELGLTVLVRTRADVRTDPGARARVRAVALRLARTPGVARVVDPGRDLRRFASRDGRLALLAAQIAPRADTGDTVDAARARLRASDVLVGGSDTAQHTIGDKVQKDLARAELYAFPILFLLSLWVFRSLVAALLPPLIGGLAIVTTFLGLRLVDSHVTGLSIFALNLVTGIGLGLAIDYSLFVVSRYREELARHGPGPVALARTMQTAGRTVLFSSLTIAAAMASLLVFPLRFLYSMGIGGTIVALVAAAIALTILPAILAALGPRVNAGAPARWRRAVAEEGRPQGAWYRIAHGVMRRPALVAAATAAVLVVAGLPFLRVDFVPADWRMLPPADQSAQVGRLVEQQFPDAAAEPMRVVIAGRPAAGAVERYRARLTALPGAGRVAAPQRLDGTTTEVDVLPPGDPRSSANLDLLDAVRAIPPPAGAAVDVGGSAAAFADQQDTLTGHLPIALAILAVTTFTILFLMTGSVVLPLKALVMNLLSVSAAFGILVLVFQDGRLESVLDFRSAGGLEATQPVLLFAIAFGLATDYGVFLLSRIKEARDSGMGEREAVAHGVERTGRIITAAALLFCVAIGAFATSGVLFIKQVGVGTALAVAIDATIVRALLVPALMALLGRWNWWAPRPLRRLHDRIGLSEDGRSRAVTTGAGA